MNIDASLYPDCDPPSHLETMEAKADYLQRVCGAFDLGLVPARDTLKGLKDWKEVFDRFPIPSSPAYHALRALYRWEETLRLPSLTKPHYQILDDIEGRSDGCEHLV